VYLEKEGATCIAASDSKGSILVPDGFKVQELIDWKQKEGSVVGYPGSKEISTEELLTTECDVLVPGALENQITAAIAEKLKCIIICDAANGPTLPEADPILHKKGILLYQTSWQILVEFVSLTWNGCRTTWVITGHSTKLQVRWKLKLSKV